MAISYTRRKANMFESVYPTRGFLKVLARMALQVSKIPTVLGLALAGDLDLTRKDELRYELASLEMADVAVLDFSKVTYADSTILGCLVVLRKRIIENGGLGTVRIEGASKTLRRVLTICGLDRVFEVAPAKTGLAAA